jgi:hypothetical protein
VIVRDAPPGTSNASQFARRMGHDRNTAGGAMSKLARSAHGQSSPAIQAANAPTAAAR